MIKHAKISGKADGVDPTLVQPSDWNADHIFTGDVTLPGNIILGGGIPPAWGPANNVIAFPGGGSIAGSTTNGEIGMYYNVYHDGVGYKYIKADVGSYYKLTAIGSTWNNAPLGGVGAAAVLTERMRLTNTGALILGATVAHSGELFRVNGGVYFDANLYVQNGIVVDSGISIATGNLNVGGTITSQGTINCQNGSIVSGNEVTATGFDVIAHLQGLNLYVAEIHGNATNYDIIARVNGVRLLDGATSWTASSSLDYKTDIAPLPGDPFAIIRGHRVVVGRYKNMPGGPLRPFLLYEDAVNHFPMAASFSPARTFVHPTTGQIQSQSEFKGLTYDFYTPLMMAALQVQDTINATVNARLAAAGIP